MLKMNFLQKIAEIYQPGYRQTQKFKIGLISWLINEIGHSVSRGVKLHSLSLFSYLFLSHALKADQRMHTHAHIHMYSHTRTSLHANSHFGQFWKGTINFIANVKSSRLPIETLSSHHVGNSNSRFLSFQTKHGSLASFATSKLLWETQIPITTMLLVSQPRRKSWIHSRGLLSVHLVSSCCDSFFATSLIHALISAYMCFASLSHNWRC